MTSVVNYQVAGTTPSTLLYQDTSGSVVIGGSSEQYGLTIKRTWATLPAAASYIGTAFISDVGTHGSFWYSDGITWGIVGGTTVLAASAVASSALTGTIVEGTLATIALPAGILGLNGTLYIDTKWTTTNNANLKTIIPRLNLTSLGGVGGTNNLSFGVHTVVQNRNSATSQLASNGTVHGYSGSTSAWLAPTENTALALNLYLNAQLAVAGDSVVLEGYVVTLYRP